MADNNKRPSEQAIKLACERARIDYNVFGGSALSITTKRAITAYACDIERWEPELCVDPVRAEAERIVEEWRLSPPQSLLVDVIERCLRSGVGKKS